MLHPIVACWQILTKKYNTNLCIGLDPDLDLLPHGYAASINGQTHFLKDVIDITREHCISYKPNLSFFESYGIDGLKSLEKVVKHIDDSTPIILDCKRGDIGNTATKQAQYIFDYFNADASTLHPYMGYDSLEPFFKHKKKFHFILGLTSNSGSKDFEELTLKSNKTLAEHVVNQCVKWQHDHNNIGVVVGADKQKLQTIRNIDPNLLFLIPGVGAQGGSYQTAATYGINNKNLAIINVTRNILYATDQRSELKKVIPRVIKSILNQN